MEGGDRMSIVGLDNLRAMEKKSFMKLQIHEKCFVLSSLWGGEVLLLKYLQN